MKQNDFNTPKENSLTQEEKNSSKSRQSGKKKLKPLQNTPELNLNLKDAKNDQTLNSQKNNNQTKKEYFNKLGLERINFQFDEYGEYPDDDFQPSIFFF